MHQGAQGRGQGGQGQYRAYGPIVFHTAIFSFRNLRSRLRIQFQWKWLSLGLQITFQWKCRANCQLKKFKSRHPHEADPLAHDVNISSLPSPESEPPSYDAITARMSSFAADDDAEEVSRLPFTVNQVGSLNELYTTLTLIRLIISFMIVETSPLTFFDTIGRIWGFYDTAFFFRLLPTLCANKVTQYHNTEMRFILCRSCWAGPWAGPRQGKAEQLSKSRKKFHPNAYKD